eukprot:CAMPEP_0181138180 /NCGR_PEP_ID=MMETSP1071-20121207/34107_1 /TAXON_ID=35127 /ORGANISM="Thalassiosira sp., Strain NH16" /LENGTH=445 /DNA_ID=CAMNT_0023224995 /DNA_START=99 /DNA_END=1436 /DNA_ORIENTATION=-
MKRYAVLLVIIAASLCFQSGAAFTLPSPSRKDTAPAPGGGWMHHRSPTALLSGTRDGEADNDEQQPSNNLPSKLLSNLRTAASDGFGTRARNVGSTMGTGDVVVPLCSNLDKRQDLAQIGLYAGVEYVICDIIDEAAAGEEGERNDRIASLKPAYPLRPHLERSDWPIELAVSDVPLWLSKATYEAGTALGTLMLAGTYLAIASILATIVRVVAVPSESMEPALMPGDVVLVTRSIVTKPRVNDVVFFDPPAELDDAIANSKIGRAAAAEAAAAASAPESSSGSSDRPEKISIVSTKGKQFLKRVVGVPGEYVGVSNANPYVSLCNDGGDTADCTYRVDRTGDYSRPDVFPDESWNRVTPTINLGGVVESNNADESSTLAKGQYFVAGDNGFRSVDSRVWGPLKEKYLFGTAKWIIYPATHFGPIQPGPFVIEKSLMGENAISDS